jgi:hypothetical protein
LNSEIAGELVQVLIGLLALDLGSEVLQLLAVQQVARLGQALSDLQVRLSVQIRRLNVTNRIWLTVDPTKKKRINF